jgi:hypothetical protein
MSLRVVGYLNGRRLTVDDGPARARVAGYGQGNTHDMTLIGGSRIESESERERELRMQREAMRQLRANR